MAEILKEIAQRRARRAFSPEAIDRETLDRIFTAATYAPSCSNKQPWRFLICNEENGLEKARTALNGGNYWAKVAPVLVVITTRDDLDCQLNDDRNYAQFDTGMATMNLMLQATKEGLYAHPMAGWDPSVVREQFGIESDTRVIALLALGRPGDSSHLNEKHSGSEVSERSRKPLSEVLQWNSWSSPAS
jgi:nitroreductase